MRSLFVSIVAALLILVAYSTAQPTPALAQGRRSPAAAESCVRATCTACTTAEGLARNGGNMQACLSAYRRCLSSCSCRWQSCSSGELCC
ncbi:MAG: hypothetical protein WCJ30_01355 [Deltaproteobacteria bacterium]